MTHLPQKNVNSIQFEKGIVHANPARFNPRFTYFEGKKPRGLFFFSQSQTHRESSELRNSSERPRRFPEIFRNSRIIFGNSETLQDKNLTPGRYSIIPTQWPKSRPSCQTNGTSCTTEFSAEPISANLFGGCCIDTPCENCEDMQNSGSFHPSSLDTAEDCR